MGLLPKDLLNDLEREENVKKRIKEFLDKPVDQPTMFNPLLLNQFWGSSAISTSSTYRITSTVSGTGGW